MLKSLIKALGFVAGVLMSGWVCAVGMGGINLTSALGESLKLEIELETASKAETNNLSVRLASPEMFKAAGIDYPYGLPPLKLQIATHADNDQPYLVITSAQPINEPFVTLLVELSWPSGKLLREYTFLLDPPGYAADQPKAVEVKPVEPTIAEEAPASAAEEVASEVTESAPLPVEENIPLAETPAPPPQTEEVAPVVKGNVASGPITVKRGDTLYQIASQAKEADANLSDISLEQMLVALYRANQQAFVGNNMNRLRAGQVLRMPEQLALDSLTHAQAKKEIRVQVADWHAYRQKLAAASGAMKEAAPGQEASGKVTATVTDPSPLAKEPAKEMVKLSRGESPGDKAIGSDKTKSTQDKVNAQQEDAIAENKTIAENKARAALLEKNILAMQRLVELKKQNDAQQKSSGKAGVLPSPSASAVASTETRAASAVNPASAVAPAVPAASPKPESAQPSLIDQILGEPLYLAGIAAVLLLLGGLGLWFKRRGQHKNKNAVSDEDRGSTTGRIAAPVVPSPETGDFTNTIVGVTGTGNAQTDDVDPISEADLFLNFGRDEQAEEILKDALIKNPGNHRIHLKLLSIYLNRRDVAAFSAIATQLQKSGDTKAWEQAAAMGLKLEPNNPMYGGDASAVRAPEEIPTKAPPEVMFDVGVAKKQPTMMDFDLGLATTQVPAAEPRQDSTLIMNSPMDFDVLATPLAAPASSEKNTDLSASQLDDLIFDVTGGHAAASAAPKEQTPEAPSAKPSEDLTFTLDIPGADKFETPLPAASKPPMEINFTEISLNLDELPAGSATTGDQDAHWQDVATKLDLATAYREMGDTAGAREILEEVVRDGDDQQRAAAQSLLQQLG